MNQRIPPMFLSLMIGMIFLMIGIIFSGLENFVGKIAFYGLSIICVVPSTIVIIMEKK